MSSHRIASIAMVWLVSSVAVAPARAVTVLGFDGLAGLVDTYDESGFHFDGGEPCFYFCPAIPEGIAGTGNLNVTGGDPLGTTGFRDIEVTRPDGAPFELVSVDLVGFEDRYPSYTEIGIHGSIGFVGLYAGGGGCYLGGVSGSGPPVIPSTLVFNACPGIDRVTVGGSGIRITTDNWTFRVVPEPSTVVLLGSGIAAVAARRRARRRCAESARF